MNITACYITKNEEKNLARSLASIRGAYDELVVVDTGSTDGTVTVAERFGARVVPFAWCDDFAAARNAALEAAHGDMILFIDADEYVSRATRKYVRDVLARAYAQGFDALLVHRIDIDGRESAVLGDIWAMRALRRAPRLRYAGRIHEELRDDGRDVTRMAMAPDTELLLYHTGYEKSVNRAKAERNLRILRAEYAEAGRTGDVAELGRLCMYLAEAYRGVGDFAQAEAFARRDIAQGRRCIADASRSYHLLLAILARDPARQAERAQVLASAVRDFPELPEFHAEYAVVRAGAGDCAGAIREMEAALACKESALGLEPHRFDAAMRKAAKQLLARWRKEEQREASVPPQVPSTPSTQPSGRRDQRPAASRENRNGRAPGRIEISACAIVKNEEKNIGRWIAVMRQCADEIIVVDTGSTDRTREIVAAEQDVRLLTFAWRDDFAAAKNFAIDAAHGRWILFPDADEFFTEETVGNIRPLLARLAPDVTVAGVLCRRENYDMDAGGRMITADLQLRIFRHLRSIRYEGRVHETLTIPEGRRMELTRDVVLLHTGYSSSVLPEKLLRDKRLLEQRIAEGKHRPIDDRYLMDIAYGLHDYDAAIAHTRHLLAQPELSDELRAESYEMWISCCMQKPAPAEETLAVMEEAERMCPAQAEFPLLHGIYLYDHGDRTAAEERLHAGLAVHAGYAERMDITSVVDNAARLLPTTYWYLGDLATARGDLAAAQEWYVKGLKQQKRHSGLLKSFWAFLQRLGAGDVDSIEILNGLYDKDRDAAWLAKHLASVAGAENVRRYYAGRGQ